MSGKKRLLRNNCLIHEEKNLKKLFTFELKIGEHTISFDQQGEKFDLKIDNESFMYTYNRLKQQDHFRYENEDDHHYKNE